jgi:hypothetical protein
MLMTTVPQYFTTVDDSTKWATEDTAIAALLLDKAGITPADIQPMRQLLPKVQSAWAGAQAASGPKLQATQSLQVGVDEVKADLSDLRATMKNNLPANDPLFSQLGLREKQPIGQDDFLAYAVRAFTNGKNLPQAQIAPIAKRKWDVARFEAALAKAQAVQAFNDTQEGAKADAKAATDQVYDLVDQIDALFRPFAKDARRVLEKTPGALDKMQLVKGVPPKPQRPAYKPRAMKAGNGNKNGGNGSSG